MSYVKAIKNKEGKRGNSCTANFKKILYYIISFSLHKRIKKKVSIPSKKISPPSYH